MTQPPQWGYAPQHRPMPPQLMTAALLHWAFAVATCGLAAFVAVGRTISENSVFWGAWYGGTLAVFGVLNVVAALAIHDPHFPQMISSRLATFITFVTFGGTLLRAVTRGDLWSAPSLVVAVVMALCVLNVFLTLGPRAKQWTAARRRLSLSQGRRPRR